MPDAPRRLSGVGLVAITLAGLCAFLDVYATQPLLPLFESLFHTTAAAAGLTVSATTIAVALSAPFAGVVADRFGRKPVIVASIFALAVPTLLAATSRTLGALIVWRFLQGVMVPGMYVVAITYITEEAGATSVGVAMAAFVTGTVIGGFAGRVIAGVAAAHTGWREAFVALGALNILGAIATWRWLPQSRHFIPRRGGGRAIVDVGDEERGAVATRLRSSTLVATYAIGFSVLFALVATFSYISFYLSAPPFGLGPAAVSGIFVVYLIGAVVTPFAGRWIDRAGSRAVLTVAVLAGIVGIALTLPHSLPLVLAGLTLACTCGFVCQASATAYLRVAAPSAVRSLASGIYVTTYYVGGSVGGLLPGFLWARVGWPGCVALVAVVQGAALVVARMYWGGARREEAGA
jgi:predicted MFS family arabinose efflux permease